MHFAPLGDRAVLITVGTSIDESTNGLVRALSAHLDDQAPQGMLDQVPAFASLVVHYDPRLVDGASDTGPYERMVNTLRTLLSSVNPADLPAAHLIEIPVCYGDELGPDLDEVAQVHAISADSVVELHCAGDYLVYMVGFMPGFAYLGGVSERIATPRRLTPRTVVPAGSVGIGGQQTGVYPRESPGGWNLIGRTPVRMFDPSRPVPALLATGDRVRFRAIDRVEYDRLLAAS